MKNYIKNSYSDGGIVAEASELLQKSSGWCVPNDSESRNVESSHTGGAQKL